MGETVGQTLLAPHRSYVDAVSVLDRIVDIRGMAHITGGGMIDNIPRALPDDQGAVVRRGLWPELPIFGLLSTIGEDIDQEELFQDFNMGIGFVLIVPKKEADKAVDALKQAGEAAYLIGETLGEPDVRVEITSA